MQTVMPHGIRSRLWPGIGYARTRGNFREEEVPGAKRNFRITRMGDQYAILNLVITQNFTQGVP